MTNRSDVEFIELNLTVSPYTTPINEGSNDTDEVLVADELITRFIDRHRLHRARNSFEEAELKQ
jgi:hypothetical protein